MQANPHRRRLSTGPRTAAWVFVSVALALAFAGCKNVPSGPGSPGQAPPAPERAGQPPTRVAWAPGFGPINQASPPQHRWYQYVQDRDCDGLLAEVNTATDATDTDKRLYGGLAKACTGAWAGAREDLANLDPGTFIDPIDPEGKLADCLMLSAYKTLKRLVEAHDSEPERAIEIGEPATADCEPPPGELGTGGGRFIGSDARTEPGMSP